VKITLNVSVLLSVVTLNVTLPVSAIVGQAGATMKSVDCPAYPGTIPTSITTGAVTFTPASATTNGTVAGTLLGLSLGSASLSGTQLLVISNYATSYPPGNSLSYTANRITNPSPPAVHVSSSS